jgi:murein DD-endopeptidase MepM/ murein hydrolase activator NlpD
MKNAPAHKPKLFARHVGNRRNAAMVLAILLTVIPSTTNSSPFLAQAQTIVGSTASPAPKMEDSRAVETLTPWIQALTVADDVTSIAPYRDTYGIVSAQQSAQYASGSSTASNSIIWPFPASTLTDRYGERPAPCNSCGTFHGGADFSHNAGQAIPAIADGVVRIAKFDSEFGQMVVIDHMVDGRQVSSLYAHMAAGSATVNVGDIVRVGNTIGHVGATGLAYGQHLHFEILIHGTNRTDPVAWLAAHVR